MSNKRKHTRRILFFFISLSLYIPVAKAEKPGLIFPVSCIQGTECWAVNYVDVNAEDDVSEDFKCNRKTYDGHKGTDFALPSIRHMKQGIDVLAAAAGKVIRLRDGQDDTLKTEDELAKIKAEQHECGNGVLIDHGDGLQTIYCHLKQNSIIVKRNQRVKAGEKIAQVGQSGMAEFPHLHLGVIWEGGVVDPYTGALNTDGCNQMKSPLWHLGLPIAYEPVVIFDGGFRAHPPNFTAIQKGELNPETLSLNSASFVFWVGFYNVEKGDKVILRITDPEGKIFNEREDIIQETRTRQYYFTGRKIGRVQLMKGQYNGLVQIIRANTPQAIMREKTFQVTVE